MVIPAPRFLRSDLLGQLVPTILIELSIYGILNIPVEH